MNRFTKTSAASFEPEPYIRVGVHTLLYTVMGNHLGHYPKGLLLSKLTNRQQAMFEMNVLSLHIQNKA